MWTCAKFNFWFYFFNLTSSLTFKLTYNLNIYLKLIDDNLDHRSMGGSETTIVEGNIDSQYSCCFQNVFISFWSDYAMLYVCFLQRFSAAYFNTLVHILEILFFYNRWFCILRPVKTKPHISETIILVAFSLSPSDVST